MPRIFHNGKVLSDFKENTNIINSSFASQCTSISNSSVYPNIGFCKNARLKSFSINEKDILVVSKSLDPNKFHGWDDISTKMIKMC